MRWFSPHPSICCFEIIDIDEANGFLTRNKRKIIHFEESKPEEELRELRKIGINEALLSIESEPLRKMLTSEAAGETSSKSEFQNDRERNGINSNFGEQKGNNENMLETVTIK